MTLLLAQTQGSGGSPLLFGGGGQAAGAGPGGIVSGSAPPAGAPAPAPMLFGGPQTSARPAGPQPGGPGVDMGPPLARLPHGIRGAVPYVPWQTLVLLVVLLLAVLAGAVAGIRWWRRRRAGRPAAPVDPWDALKSRLAALRSTGAFGPREREEYFFQLSLLLREGIELRTKLRATDLTLKELAGPLRRKLPLPTGETEAVLGFLERADLVKFAGAPADQREAEAARARCGAWIERLRPRSIDEAPVSVDASRDQATVTGGASRDQATVTGGAGPDQAAAAGGAGPDQAAAAAALTTSASSSATSRPAGAEAEVTDALG